MFNFFGGSGSQKPPKRKETFTNRQKTKYTYSAPKPRSTRKGPKCPLNNYIPHHRNLGLQPGASSDEIKTAWRRMSLRLHPDKIRDPAQKEVAAAAMSLVNEAYEYLYKEGSWAAWIGGRKYNEGIDSSERLRRKNEASEEGVRGACHAIVRRKPWFWAYKPESQCLADGSHLCGEFWATLIHNIVDGMIPTKTSDALWEKVDKDWRLETKRPDYEKLSFYGPCFQTYTVMLPTLKSARIELPKWSRFTDTTCNTVLNTEMPDLWWLLALIVMVIILFRKIWMAILCYCVKLPILGILLCLQALYLLLKKVLWVALWPVNKLDLGFYFKCRVKLPTFKW
jgi:hypothetical protein